MYQRVDITAAAEEVIDRLTGQHGKLMFHQSGGCCDGSSPMCFPVNDFKVGDSDVLLGEIHDCPFYMARDQFELWQNTHLTVDVVPGRGASFSAEIPLGVRFVTKSRLFSEKELEDLRPVAECGIG